MTKINKEEYKFLKSLDDKWKWIARDDNYGGSIFCFRKKPNKDIRRGEWGPDTTQYKWLGKCEILFQFIKWEDREPYNIAELIEEYEHKEFYDYVGWKYAESEETEVKKNIEWLSQWIEEYENEVIKVIEKRKDEKDEVDGFITTLSRGKQSAIKRIKQKINQPDEPEVLSQEFIDKYKVDYDNWMPAVPIVHLQNLLVPKQEKVEVPRFVADILEENTFADLPTAFEELFSANAGHYYGEDVCKWIVSNEEAFARAWLDGYTVEEEQKYYLKIGNLYLAEPLGDMTSDIVRMTRDKGVAYQFTDEKSIATHLDKFEGTEAVKVEELEE